MRKRLLATLLVLCMVLGMLPGKARAAEYSGSFKSGATWSYSDGTLTIQGRGSMDDYNFSSAYTTDAPWYDYREQIHTVHIGDGVTNIGDWAFYDCSAVTSVEISNSVTTIGENAFRFCFRLTSVVIPSSVTTIESYAFYMCGLTSVKIPNSVTTIGESAFGNCDGLVSAGPTGGDYAYQFDWTESIPDNAFHTCDSLKNIIIPDSVTTIGENAFWYCDGLTNIIIPPKVTNIGKEAFRGCSGLKNVIIPDSVTSIGEAAFQDCSSLNSINIPSGVREIPWGLFLDCANLSSVQLAEGITSIETSAFSDCSSLSSIHIPASVTSIGYAAFNRCSAMTQITVAPDNPNFIAEDGVLFSRDRTILYYCVGGKIGAYEIPSSVTDVEENAFSGSSLSSVTIPGSIKAIRIVHLAHLPQFFIIALSQGIAFSRIICYTIGSGFVNRLFPACANRRNRSSRFRFFWYHGSLSPPICRP